MIKNIIFDMDGVLIDSIPSHFKAWKKVLSEHGISIDTFGLALHEGSNQELFLSDVLKYQKIKKTKKEQMQMCNLKDKYFSQMRINKFPIIQMLKYLKKKGIKLAVGTGDSSESCNRNLKIFPNIFNVVVNGDDVYHGKPNPETYNKARKLLKGKKEETLVIENAPLGIESAKKAGLKCYAISTSLPKKYLKKADKVFENHKGLFTYLKKNIC